MSALYDAFDEDTAERALQDFDNDEVLWMSGDIPDGREFEEDEAVAILANYGQVRKFLHKKQMSRGYQRQKTTTKTLAIKDKPAPRRSKNN